MTLDYFQFRSGVLTTPVSPLVEATARDPGGVTMEEKLLHLLHHRSTDCGCCRMAQQMLLNFLPLHPGSLVMGTEPRMLLLAAHQRIESVPCRRREAS